MAASRTCLMLLVVLGAVMACFVVTAGAQSNPDIARLVQEASGRSDSIRISLVSDKMVARPGDTISLTAETDRHCYLKVVNVDTSGNVIQLWPNRDSGWSGRVSPHTSIRIPGPGAGFKIQVDGSQPVETIIAYAATDERGLIPEHQFREVPGATIKRFSGDTRTFLEELHRGLRFMKGSDRCGVAQLDIRVEAVCPPSPETGSIRVMVEMRVQKDYLPRSAMTKAARMDAVGFRLDGGFSPVPMRAPNGTTRKELQNAGERIVLVRGVVSDRRLTELERNPDVVKVWRDKELTFFAPGSCPVEPCDCEPKIAKGAIIDVARYLGVDQIWNAGYRGQGIVVGIVDSGITAEGRCTGSGPKLQRVVGGCAEDWGTKTFAGGHGNMTATDVLGMAPEANLYDLRIAEPNESPYSAAVKVFQWAIERHRKDGTPHILSNSWGVPNKQDFTDLAENPDHPLTRKVIEALNEGLIVLFSAGNCGQVCPDTRCKTDTGPGKSIWGPNGHPRVISVGAANIKSNWIGYSSEGPASFEKEKPDFCAISHFKGFFESDTGTSAACPIAAGVIALLKQARPWLSQDAARMLLRETAKDIGPTGWDPHSGAGIIQPKAAFDLINNR